MSTSSLRSEFPLSTTKKFWKKYIEKSGGIIGLAVVIGFITLLLPLASGSQSGPDDFPFMMSVYVTIGLFVLFTIAYMVYLKFYIKNYFYSEDSDFITIKKGVFMPVEIHVQWQKIQDVYVDQDVLDRIFGLYDVHISSATSTSGIEAHIDGIEKQHAEGLKTLLLNRIKGGSQATKTEMQRANAEVKYTSTQKLSSQEFPLKSKWVTIKYVFMPISSVIWSVIIYFVFTSKVKEPIPFEYMLIGMAILFLVILIWQIIRFTLWRSHYAFELKEDSIYYKNGVFSIYQTNLPYSTIQDISVSQGIVDRMFGFYSVVVENAAGIGGPRGDKTGKSLNIVSLNKSEADKLSDTFRGIIKDKAGKL